MISWFRETAPIRQKMRILGITYVGLAVLSAIFASGLIPLESTVARIAVTGAIVAITALVAILSAGAIVTPYVATVERMEGLARGDLTSPVAYGDYRDCVGRMTKAMEVFRNTAIAQQQSEAIQNEVVTAMGDALRQIADGNLWVRLDRPFGAEYEALRSDFNSAVAAIADALTAVIGSASAINTGASEISHASDDLSRRTEQQAASLEETAAAMDEITATVRETASGGAAVFTLIPNPSPFEGEGSAHFAHHPTLPSRETATSFWASTANSIGSCCSTSFTNPLTSSWTASSWERPRCMT